MRENSSPEEQEQRRPLVLVADDDFISAEIMRSALSDLYTVHVVQNGKEAVRSTEILHPDLIIMDEVMPEMNGSAALHVLKQNPATADVPVMIMTGLNDDRDEAFLLQTGACDYLIKPISRSRLLARVQLQMILRREKADLSASAYHDQLSGLKNRHGFTREMSRLKNDILPPFPISLCMIDIDKFKYINDTFGHDAGDKIIHHLGKVMLQSNQSTRGTQFFRIGGDEFINISCGLNKAEMKKIFINIISDINKIIKKEISSNCEFSLSVGASMTNDTLPKNIDKWIKHADMTLYKCKNGQSKIKFSRLTDE